MESIKKNLIAKGYEACIFETKAEAAEYLNSVIDGTTVGIGGSVTIKEMGLYDKLKQHNEVYWHNEKPENLSVDETRRKACGSEIYISSVNGISETGEIVNIDYTGNRVAAITFGPKEVYLVIGKNKIAPDLDGALYRARNIASPKNAQRLNRKTPCAIKGDKCYDCDSPDRICCNLQILWRRPVGTNIKVILVNEDLGY